MTTAPETSVRERLREQPLPGEAEAAARSWPVVEAALAERARGGARRRLGLRLVIAAAALGIALLALMSPAAAWIEEQFSSDAPSRAPAFAGLPDGSGPVLAISRSGAYAVHPDGGSRWLGSFSDAGWSPRGLHVVGVEGRRIVAVTPTGKLKWTVVRRGRVHHPSWSQGAGFAVAYLERDELRVVAGDGTPSSDRALRRRAAAMMPAWRPGSDRLLAYATMDGFVETVDVLTGRTRWRTELPADARSLAWAGRRLVALSSRSVTVLSARGRTLFTIPLPGVARDFALHPSGALAAVLVGRGGAARVIEAPLAEPMPGQGSLSQTRFFQGDVDGLAWSADGRRLLLSWRGAGQWLVLLPDEHVRALHGVSRELGAAGGFPRVVSWCCPR
jgi:hypothetical protein